MYEVEVPEGWNQPQTDVNKLCAWAVLSPETFPDLLSGTGSTLPSHHSTTDSASLHNTTTQSNPSSAHDAYQAPETSNPDLTQTDQAVPYHIYSPVTHTSRQGWGDLDISIGCRALTNATDMVEVAFNMPHVEMDVMSPEYIRSRAIGQVESKVASAFDQEIRSLASELQQNGSSHEFSIDSVATSVIVIATDDVTTRELFSRITWCLRAREKNREDSVRSPIEAPCEVTRYFSMRPPEWAGTDDWKCVPESGERASWISSMLSKVESQDV